MSPMQIDYPSIEPLPANAKSPLWSVMITAYHRTDYLETCLRSVLEQNIPPDEMQIEVVDDCSANRDSIQAVVEKVGQGRISFYSQPKNVGIYANWNTCIHRARGRWVHILSDDDLILPGFYSAYSGYSDRAEVVLGQSIFIDEEDQWLEISQPLQKSSGLLTNALMTLGKGNQIRTPGIVVARAAYEQVGGFATNLAFTPDWEMWTRLAASVKIAYVNRPYSLFRTHSTSETSKLVLSGASVTDSLLASEIIQSRLNKSEDKTEIRGFVNQWLAAESHGLSRKLIDGRQYKAALRHAFWAMRLMPSLSYLKNIGIVLFKVVSRYIAKEIVLRPLTETAK
jgi:glycosyltransferase involved in cell wall biosynthesis